MKKITLDIDALKVTSFMPEAEPDGTRGTVRGGQASTNPICLTKWCETAQYRTTPCDTCDAASCVDTCSAPYQVQC
jgi:hypothetical protein